ncbi:MAG: DUF4296 domain-containing protein [Bacteroidia bacterium]
MKQLPFLVFAVLSLLLFGCSSNQSVPEGVIPDTTMSQLIVEFTLIDAAYNVSVSTPSSIKFRPEMFYESVLEEKGYTRESFNRSISWYTTNSKRLLRIYDEALIDLSKRQAELDR